MKALILAAGFGTRLLPCTKKVPKALFPILSNPVLDHIIQKLEASGCEQILINTHHLSEQIKTFIEQKNYNIQIKTIYEPVILDTGGAIANAEPFLKNNSFFVINADIVSNIDLQKVYQFHKQSDCLATLVLHDYEPFNKIKVDNTGCIQNFNCAADCLAFTGIQVLSPQIFNCFPDKKIFSSIEVYKNLCSKKQIKAFVAKDIFWSDIGTTQSYSRTSMLTLAASGFQISYDRIKDVSIDKLAGDGSDRKWYRATYKNRSLIVSDHGICMPGSERLLQLKAFVHIGNHIFSQGIAAPRILDHEAFSGMVLLDDLGDIHLDGLIKQKNKDEFIQQMYKNVIDSLIDFSIKGFKGFRKEWTCQTATYSKQLIIEKECLYFMEEFIQNHKNFDVIPDNYLTEFQHIADHALKHGFTGLMHRDMQSKNIMIHNSQPCFIDFQSARSGPLQYDLASLLIDPYVAIEDQIQNKLLLYTMESLKLNKTQRQNFLHSYKYCCLTRNLQILGAFSFLSHKKKKKKFEQYIPDAVKSLKKIIFNLNTDKLPRLSKLVQTI